MATPNSELVLNTPTLDLDRRYTMKTLITSATLLAMVLSAGSAMASGGGDRTIARYQARLAQVEMEKRQAQEAVAQEKELAEKAKRG
jgi:cell division protein FtsX